MPDNTTDTKAELVHATLEQSPHHDGVAMALYFKGVPTKEQIVTASRSTNLSLSPVDGANFWTIPTPVSKLAGLTRIIINDIG